MTILPLITVLLFAVVFGAIVSMPIPYLFTILIFSFFLFIVLTLTNPLHLLSLLIFIRPVVDQLSSVYFTEDINVLSLFSVFYILFFVYLAITGQIRNFIPSPIRGFYLFLLSAIAAVIMSVSPLSSTLYFVRFVSLAALFLISFNLIKSKEDAALVMRSVIYSAFIPISYGFFQYFTNTGKKDFEFARLRIFSTFAHPNMYAFYLVIILFSLLYLYFLNESLKRRITTSFYLVLSSLLIIQLLLTYTRGAWIGCFLGFSLLALLIKQIRTQIFIACLSIIVLCFPIFVERATDLIHPVNSYHLSSLRFRFMHWQKLFNATLSTHPLLGFGIGQSLFVAKKESSFVLIPHNDYLRVFIECGLVGLGCYLIFWFCVAKELLHYFFKHSYTVRSGIVLSMVISMLTCSLADNLVFSISVVGYVFIILAVNQKIHVLEETAT